MAGETPVAGNTRTGRLFHLGSGNWLGERIAKGGRFDTRKFFDMNKHDAIIAWEEWRSEKEEEALIKLDRKRKAKEAGTMPIEEKAKTATKVPAGTKKVSLLVFKGGRQQKVIAAYTDGDSALKMATALEAAAEATGLDGEYEVDEVPLWA